MAPGLLVPAGERHARRPGEDAAAFAARLGVRRPGDAPAMR
ncbi:hypothetical protein ACQPZZ_25280 [Microbispora sp. CA-135349]